jgi:Domain of unknown function (DUF3786)
VTIEAMYNGQMQNASRKDDCTAGSLPAVSIYPDKDNAWQELAGKDPDDVCRRAVVNYNRDGGYYTLRSFGADFHIFPKERSISAGSPQAAALLNNTEHFFGPSLVCYLVRAKDIPPSGRLINPIHIKGGRIFSRGTHVLPLDVLALRYDNDIEGFLARGIQFGGEPLKLGDISIRLMPFPRVPVVITLWRSDDEFPARADILLDSTCNIQIPTDVIWSAASMSLIILL